MDTSIEYEKDFAAAEVKLRSRVENSVPSQGQKIRATTG